MSYTGKEIGKTANMVRRILINNNYCEVTSPILRNSDSAVNSRFLVHGLDSYTGYLRDCMETPLRKYIDEETPKVFEIGPCFRQGEVDETHRQEFYMMELYSVNEGLSAMKLLVESIVSDVLGGSIPSITISLSKVIKQDVGVDIRTASTGELILAICNKYNDISGGRNHEVVNRYIDYLEKQLCIERGVIYFLDHYPVCTIDTAARLNDTNIILRFETFVNGLEIAHAFVDCMDETEIRTRVKSASTEDVEKCELIEITKLGYLLPTVGLGIGIDRLCMMQEKYYNGTIR